MTGITITKPMEVRTARAVYIIEPVFGKKVRTHKITKIADLGSTPCLIPVGWSLVGEGLCLELGAPMRLEYFLTGEVLKVKEPDLSLQTD